MAATTNQNTTPPTGTSEAIAFCVAAALSTTKWHIKAFLRSTALSDFHSEGKENNNNNNHKISPETLPSFVQICFSQQEYEDTLKKLLQDVAYVHIEVQPYAQAPKYWSRLSISNQWVES